MDINNILEPFHQFGHHIQEVPEQARQFVEQYKPGSTEGAGPRPGLLRFAELVGQLSAEWDGPDHSPEQPELIRATMSDCSSPVHASYSETCTGLETSDQEVESAGSAERVLDCGDDRRIVRNGLRAEPVENLTVGADEELLEVPLDVAGGA
jgi:hypothetical protein